MTIDSPSAALEALRRAIEPVGVEHVPIADAAGRVLARSLCTDRPSPAADISAMDGFAVRARDLELERLPIAGEVRIGHRPPDLAPGTAVRVVTGGALPAGADTVVRREDVVEEGDVIRVGSRRATIAVGADIRVAGENGGADSEVVSAGTVVTPPVASAVACFAQGELAVRRRVRVAILVTGDELVEPGAPASPWQVRDSNGPTLRASLTEPWVEVSLLRRVTDDASVIREEIERALAGCDALVLSGGVSMGTHDHVPDALRAAGVEVLFHRLPMRPGKPVLGGIAHGGRPVLALPGNPVSVLVTARRFAAPAIARRAGIERVTPAPLVSLRPPTTSIGAWWHRPVRLASDGSAAIVDTRGAGDVVGIARSDGFVEVPPDAAGPGPFPFFPW